MKNLLFLFLMLTCIELNAQVELVSTGSSNAYILSFPGVFSYSNGISITFKSNFANTATATINVNGLGAKTIKKLGSTTNLATNDILSGQVVTLVYDGTNFQMTSGLGNAPGGGGAQTLIISNDTLSISGGNSVVLPGGANLGWNLIGNAGTDSAVNFVGTTNPQPLMFRTNNLSRMKLRVDGALELLNGLNTTAVGLNALNKLSTGAGNTAFGTYTLASNTTGAGNVALGGSALFSNLSGGSNTAVGVSANTSNTTGNANVAVGQTALRYNTTGATNTAVGAGAFVANFTGSGNTALGYNTNVGADNLDNATAIGANAFVEAANSMVLGSINGVNGAMASTNVGIGTTYPSASLHVDGTLRYRVNGVNPTAGYVLTTNAFGDATWEAPGGGGGGGTLAGDVTGALGTNTVEKIRGYNVLGIPPSMNQVLQFNGVSWAPTTLGSGGGNPAWELGGNASTNPNINFVGTTDNVDLNFRVANTRAGTISASGSNTSFGIGGIANNTSGTGNTALGYNSLLNNNTGSGNTALGLEAMLSNLNSNNNTAIGNGALRATAGDENVAVGQAALNQFSGSYSSVVGTGAMGYSTGGDFNSALGYHALLNTTSGFNNAFGSNALAANTSGTNNVAMGSNALGNSTFGSSNVALGNSSLSQSITGGENVALGYTALLNNIDGSYNTAVGRGAMVTTASGSYNTGLGYMADVATGLTNATAIGAKAYVEADNSIVLGAINTINGATSNTKVGIGTTTPSATLHVNGDFRLEGNGAGAGKVLVSDASGNGSWQSLGPGGGVSTAWEKDGNTGTDSTVNFIGTTDDQPLLFHSGNTERMKLRQDGGLETFMSNQNIAIGSSSLVNSNPYNSIAIGIEAGRNISSTSIAIGTHALDGPSYDESNAGNIAIGHEAMTSNLEKGGNTAVGNRALNQIGGYGNTALGNSAMSNATWSSGNTALGSYTLSSNITGNQNLALGAGADVLVDNLEYASAIGSGAYVGVSNGMVLGRDSGVTFVGIGTSYPSAALDLHGQFKYVFGVPGFGKVLTSDADGNATWQVASGGGGGGAGWNLVGNAATDPNSNFVGTVDAQPLFFKVQNVKTGKLDLLKNIAWGGNALVNNTTGQLNVAMGSGALQKSTEGSSMVAIGDSALYNQNIGYGNSYGNVAVGSHTLYSNIAGMYNVAIGTGAMHYSISPQFNTAIGFGSMESASGNINTAVGLGSFAGGGGSYNCAFGYYALGSNLGNYNIGIGYDAATECGGIGNIGIGRNALQSSKGGSNNTALGHFANVGDFLNPNFSNSTALGANSNANASNKIRFGDAAVTVIEGQVAYSFPSDGRFKTNINDADVKGLDFINKLRAVNYNFDTKKYEEFLTKNMPDSIRKNYLNKDFSKSTALRQTGFIAQEVEKAAKDVGYDFSGGLHIPENDNDNYSVAYSQFVVPLVKSVQELNKKVEALEKENAALKSKSGTPVTTSYETTYVKTKAVSAEDLQNQINDLKKMIEGLKKK